MRSSQAQARWRTFSCGPGLRLLGQGDIVSHYTTGGTEISESYHWPPGSCIAHPEIQTIIKLPTGTSAPNTVITKHAVRALGLTWSPTAGCSRPPGG